jgi:hypothetical protein
VVVEKNIKTATAGMFDKYPNHISRAAFHAALFYFLNIL